MTMKQSIALSAVVGLVIVLAACNFAGTISVDGKIDLPDVCSGDDADECGQGRFCKFAEGNCGVPGVVGFCEDVPDACAEIFMPVCGCDGMTYSNACSADMAGVSITSSEGGCDDLGDDDLGDDEDAAKAKADAVAEAEEATNPTRPGRSPRRG